MKTITLNTFHGDWQAVARELERTGEPIALLIDQTPYGILLPAAEGQRVIARYADRRASRRQQPRAASGGAESGDLPTYLELLRDDPSLVPVVDGQPLAFVTMMNSSFVDAEQLYEFVNPRTQETIVYRASELRDAIGRPFAPVEFIPDRPRDVVEGKVKLR